MHAAHQIEKHWLEVHDNSGRVYGGEILGDKAVEKE